MTVSKEYKKIAKRVRETTRQKEREEFCKKQWQS
jgi:hypothetical protein